MRRRPERPSSTTATGVTYMHEAWGRKRPKRRADALGEAKPAREEQGVELCVDHVAVLGEN